MLFVLGLISYFIVMPIVVGELLARYLFGKSKPTN